MEELALFYSDDQPVRDQIATSTYHSAVIRGGRLYTFGSGSSSRLGVKDRGDRIRPQFIPLPFTPVTVTVSWSSTVVVSEEGAMYVFGLERLAKFGQLVHIKTPAIRYVRALNDGFLLISDGGELYTMFNNRVSGAVNLGFKVKDVSVGSRIVLLLSEGGKVYCYDQTMTELRASYDIPFQVTNIAVSDYTFFFITENGDLYETGLYQQQQEQIIIPLAFKVVELSVGRNYFAVISESGAVYAFRLRDNDSWAGVTSAVLPCRASKVYCHDEHFLVYCGEVDKIYGFGVNSYGQLGVGDVSLVDADEPLELKFRLPDGSFYG